MVRRLLRRRCLFGKMVGGLPAKGLLCLALRHRRGTPSQFWERSSFIHKHRRSKGSGCRARKCKLHRRVGANQGRHFRGVQKAVRHVRGRRESCMHAKQLSAALVVVSRSLLYHPLHACFSCASAAAESTSRCLTLAP